MVADIGIRLDTAAVVPTPSIDFIVGKPEAVDAGLKAIQDPTREKQGAWLSLSISRQNIHPVSNGGGFMGSVNWSTCYLKGGEERLRQISQ